MKRVRSRTAIALVIALTAAWGTEPATASVTPQPADLNALSADGSVFNAEQLSDRTRRDPFAGFHADPETRVVSVYVGPQATSDSVAALTSLKLPTGWSISTPHVARTWSTLEQIQSRVFDGSSFAATYGPSVATASIDSENNRVDIGMTSPSAEAYALANVEFGINSTALSQQDLPTLTSQKRTSEENGPYHGGGRVNVTLTCTEGFTILINGGHYGLTAGHCSDANGHSLIETSSPYNEVGTIQNNSSFDNQWDTAYYKYTTPYTWTTTIWRGDANNSFGSQVKESATPSSDTAACSDGSFTYENCSTIVDASANGTTCANFTGSEGTEHVCHLGILMPNSSKPVVQGGDSGGPAYMLIPSGGVAALGTIVGVDSKTKYGYFQTIQSIVSHWGGSLYTFNG